MTSDESVTKTVNIKEKRERFSLRFSSVAWLALVFLATVGALVLRHDLLLVLSSAFLLCVPALLDLLMEDGTAQNDSKDVWIVFSWLGLALLAIWGSGAAISPMTILLVLAPLHAISRKRFRLGIEASVFAALGFVGIALIDHMGLSGHGTGWLGPLSGLGALICVLQTSVFIGSTWSQFKNFQDDLKVLSGWRIALEDAPVYILGLNRSGKITSSMGNDKFLKLPEPMEFRDYSITDLFDGCEQIKDIDGHPVLLAPVWSVDLDIEARLVKARDGFRMVLSPLSEAYHEAERLKALSEEQNIELESQSRWLASIGHEMKNMLNPIGGYVDLIASEQLGPIGDNYKSFANTIKQGTEHLNMLVDDMMIASKSGSDRLRLSPERLDLRYEIEETVKLIGWMSDAHSVTILLSDGPDYDVYADRKALRQIMMNLLSNAIKYSPERGRVSVSVSKDQYGVRIEVKDEGEGIDAEDIKRLGEPFFQGQNAKNKAGTGLGLSIVKLLATSMRGHFGIESRKGEGTRAFVWLPPFTGQVTPLEEEAIKRSKEAATS